MDRPCLACGVTLLSALRDHCYECTAASNLARQEAGENREAATYYARAVAAPDACLSCANWQRDHRSDTHGQCLVDSFRACNPRATSRYWIHHSERKAV